MDKTGLKAEDRFLMNSTIRLYRLFIRSEGGEAIFKILKLTYYISDLSKKNIHNLSLNNYLIVSVSKSVFLLSFVCN
jgi:hypothetical protein